MNTIFREGVVPNCSKIIVEGQPPVLICILGDLAYPLFSLYNERIRECWKKWGRAVFLAINFNQLEWLKSVCLVHWKHDLDAFEEMWTLTSMIWRIFYVLVSYFINYVKFSRSYLIRICYFCTQILFRISTSKAKQV